MKSIGERVRYYRKSKGLSMAALDRKAAVGLDFLSKLENDKMTKIRMGKLYKIAKVLDVSLEELAG